MAPESQETVREIVARHCPGDVLVDVVPLRGGVSADVYRVSLKGQAGDRQRVLRVHGARHGGHSAELEFALLTALHGLGLPVPEPIAASQTGGEAGHEPYVLLSYVEGTTAIPEKAAKARIAAMADALADVHRVEVTGLPDLPGRNDPLPELLGFIPSGPDSDETRRMLASLTDTAWTGRQTLLHGDFWPENVIWSEGELAGIIDWEDAAIGDPMSDVACSSLEMRYLFGVDGAAEFRSAYAVYHPIDEGRLTVWLAYVSAAALKHMGDWGLPERRLAHMRRIATETLSEALSAIRSRFREQGAASVAGP